MKDLKSLVMVGMAVTVCSCILILIIVAVCHVGEVSPEFREKLFGLLSIMLGAVLLWAGGKVSEPKP